MFDQLNRFMALLALCGLLTRPAIAAPEGYQTLVVNGDTLVVQMAESLPTNSADSLVVALGLKKMKKKEGGAGKRIAKKLGAGTLLGSLSGLIGAVIVQIAVGLGEPGVDGIGGGAGLVMGGIIGHTVGSGIGVTLVDPHDYYILPIVGSLAGMRASVEVPQYKEVPEFLPLFCGPVIGATIMSELLRKPPESRRISVGLVPNPKGGLSAIATLRF